MAHDAVRPRPPAVPGPVPAAGRAHGAVPVRVLGAVALAGALALAGCSGGQDGSTSDASGSTTLTVLAAASLTESFTELGDEFEAAHPGTTVQFSFGSSGTLATQVVAGAPADVFAAASPTTMQQAVDGGAVTTSTPFASNSLEVVTPAGNPAGITSLADLAGDDVKVALCVETAPCGANAKAMLEADGIDVTPTTYAEDVKATLTAVSLDEVDAGIVYVTDVVAADEDVEGIEIPEDQNVVTSYPIAVVDDSEQADLAQEFIDLVLSDDGQDVLATAGFEPAP